MDEQSAPWTLTDAVSVETEFIGDIGEMGAQEVIDYPAIATAPTSLRCVSDVAVHEANPRHNVLRVTLTPDRSEGRRIIVNSGAMFRRHGDDAISDTEIDSGKAIARVDENGVLHVVSGPSIEPKSVFDRTFSATLTKSGAFFFGTLTESSCHRRVDRPVTCWDPSEVFNSRRRPVPGFKAQFNWEKGRCTDANGDDALNEIPVEFVRETGMGVCADLRGADLNGEDYGYPELSSWNLQGANLEGARLFFANMRGAILHGAKMSGIDFGYAAIDGTLDEFTELPSEGCVVTDRSWGGCTVQCSR